MRLVLKVISGLALVAVIAPSAMFLAGRMELATLKLVMLIATVVWFIATPCWMGRTSS
jgi:hypothetical protein